MIRILASGRHVLVSLSVLSVTAAWSQAPSKAPIPKLSFHYQDKPAANPAKAADAGLPKLVVHVELQEGWHINSQAPLDSFLVPTTLDVTADGLEFGKPEYPKPVLQHSEVMGGDLSLFTGAFDVQVPFTAKAAASKAAPRPRTRVTLNYQSCNNNMCLPPKSITLEQ
ncbi:MAG: putative rane protein [Fibrobacteres bacterium]|nr:putative rane protein [Fibrobacterota bacterium]